MRKGSVVYLFIIQGLGIWRGEGEEGREREGMHTYTHICNFPAGLGS